MNIDLYAQLHGLAKAVQKSHAHATQKREEDSEFERTILEYANLVAEEEKENFREGVESVSAHANKVREQVVGAMHEFARNYENGFNVICKALEAEGLEMPEIAEEKLKVFDDPDAFMEAIENGKSIYELLGFSYETLSTFYEALNKLFEKEEYAKVKDGFFFLITLSPGSTEFWTGLGITSSKVQEYEKAIEAFVEALGLDPTAKDAYLGCIHAYVKANKVDDADRLCDEGIEYAKAHSDTPWARELEEMLNEAKSVLKTNFS